MGVETALWKLRAECAKSTALDVSHVGVRLGCVGLVKPVVRPEQGQQGKTDAVLRFKSPEMDWKVGLHRFRSRTEGGDCPARQGSVLPCLVYDDYNTKPDPQTFYIDYQY